MQDQVFSIDQFILCEKQEYQAQDVFCDLEFQNLLKLIEGTDWRKNLKKYINFYHLQIYKLESLNPKSIRSLYYKLKEKYQRISGENNRIYWFQNELKIFVWLLIASDQAFGITLDYYADYQIQFLSRSFYRINKNLCYYQFKLLTCLEFDEHWDQEQNLLLSSLVKKYDFKCSWTTISKELFLESDNKYLRTAHSCREKWQNHLDRRLIKGNWSIQDDYIIVKNRIALGKRWSLIAKVFGPTRTEHMIKNRFKVILRRESHKKEVRAIEELSVCQQIEKKLFQHIKVVLGASLDSNTAPNSSSNSELVNKPKDVEVKIEQKIQYVEIKQQYLQSPESFLFGDVKVNYQDWQSELSAIDQKCSNSIPQLIDEQYSIIQTNPNLMQESKIEFFF